MIIVAKGSLARKVPWQIMCCFDLFPKCYLQFYGFNEVWVLCSFIGGSVAVTVVFICEK